MFLVQKKGLRNKGILGEKLAVSLLQQRGYHIIECNYYSRYGEIDIVAQQQTMLVFVEIKMRYSSLFGLPEEAFTAKKQERLRKTIYQYLEEKQLGKADWRCDLVVIELEADNTVRREEIFENVLEDKNI